MLYQLSYFGETNSIFNSSASGHIYQNTYFGETNSIFNNYNSSASGHIYQDSYFGTTSLSLRSSFVVQAYPYHITEGLPFEARDERAKEGADVRD